MARENCLCILRLIVDLEDAEMKNNNEFKTILPLVFKAIWLAIPVAVVVLNVLKAAPLETQVMLLGFGMFGLAIAVINKEEDHE